MLCTRKIVLSHFRLYSKESGWAMVAGHVRQEFSTLENIKVPVIPMFWNLIDVADKAASKAIREKLARLEIKEGATVEIDVQDVITIEKQWKDEKDHNKGTWISHVPVLVVYDLNLVTQGSGERIAYKGWVKKDQSQGEAKTETKAEDHTKAEAEDVARVAD